MKRIALSLLAALALTACAAEEDVAPASSAVDESPDASIVDDITAVCTRRIEIPCGVILGRVVYCQPCVCRELPGCNGSPRCSSCAEGF